MRRFLCVCGIFMVLLFLPFQVHGAESSSFQEIYGEQAEKSGAGELPEALPDDVRKKLETAGVEGPDWRSIRRFAPDALLRGALDAVSEKKEAPLKAAGSVLAVILLCALLGGIKLTFGDGSLGGAVNLAGTLCVCAAVVTPVVACIGEAASVIRAAAAFLLACIPVLAGILIAGGHPLTAGSYQFLMVGAGNIISLTASGFLVPLMNIFLAVSVISSLSSSLNLSGLCEAFHKSVKWVLGLGMTAFTGLLALQSMVSSAADGAGTKTAKFVVSSFVPVVGGALGDALATVQGCVKLLRSGVGAFGLLGLAFLFLPVLLECVLWMLTLTVCAGIGDVFALREISGLLGACCRVVETMAAILLCCLTLMIVSTVLVLTAGGGGG